MKSSTGLALHFMRKGLPRRSWACPAALRGVLKGEGASATTAPKCTKGVPKRRIVSCPPIPTHWLVFLWGLFLLWYALSLPETPEDPLQGAHWVRAVGTPQPDAGSLSRPSRWSKREDSRLVAAAEAAARDDGEEGPHGLIVRQDELEDAPDDQLPPRVGERRSS